MKISKLITDFLKTKGVFCLLLLVIILIGELGDAMYGHLKDVDPVSRYRTFFIYYGIFVAAWLVLSVIVGYFKKSPTED